MMQHVDWKEKIRREAELGEFLEIQISSGQR